DIVFAGGGIGVVFDDRCVLAGKKGDRSHSHNELAKPTDGWCPEKAGDHDYSSNKVTGRKNALISGMYGKGHPLVCDGHHTFKEF
ncbi:MAG TPA: hypothetical protein PKY05_07810, partial [Fibrobacteria bacterium]|nr:hypothetical protein [Fibrobacteria bacterium]